MRSVCTGLCGWRPVLNGAEDDLDDRAPAKGPAAVGYGDNEMYLGSEKRSPVSPDERTRVTYP